jgi:hypothetical protein
VVGFIEHLTGSRVTAADIDALSAAEAA